MSCTFTSSGQPKYQVQGNNPSIIYAGNWKSNGVSPVSNTTGDTATFTFTGTSIQVSGSLSSSKAKIAYQISGQITTCGGSNYKQLPSPGWLFQSSTFPQEQMTLLITNKSGDELSLRSLQVFGDDETSPQAQSTTAGSPQNTGPPPSSPPPHGIGTQSSPQPGSVSAISSSGPAPPTGTSSQPFSSRTTLPFPDPPVSSSTDPSPNLPGDGPSPSPTNPNDVGSGTESLSVSSYMTVSTVNGSTITIIAEKTVVVPETAATQKGFRGLSQGALAGAVVGSLLLFLLLIGVALWWRRRRRNRVRFLYGISNLDFEPAMGTHSTSDLQSQGGGVRDSGVTLYSDSLPPYKRPLSYGYLPFDVKTRPPSEHVAPAVAGDRMLYDLNTPSAGDSADEQSTDRSGSVSASVSRPEAAESVTPA